MRPSTLAQEGRFLPHQGGRFLPQFGVGSRVSLPQQFRMGSGLSLPQFSPLAVLGPGRRQRRNHRSRSPQTSKQSVSKEACFQKKIYVFEYDPNEEQSFTRTQSSIIVSGLLPEIPLSASEEQARSEVVEFLRNSKTKGYNFECCTSSDFEFMQVSGKVVQVAQTRKDFQWTGRAIRNLAGQGSVYVRLTQDFKVPVQGRPTSSMLIGSSSESDTDFEPQAPSRDHQPTLACRRPLQDHVSDPCCSTQSSGYPFVDRASVPFSSVPQASNSVPSKRVPSPPSDTVEISSESDSQVLSDTDANITSSYLKAQESGGLDELCSICPQVSREAIKLSSQLATALTTLWTVCFQRMGPSLTTFKTSSVEG